MLVELAKWYIFRKETFEKSWIIFLFPYLCTFSSKLKEMSFHVFKKRMYFQFKVKRNIFLLKKDHLLKSHMLSTIQDFGTVLVILFNKGTGLWPLWTRPRLTWRMSKQNKYAQVLAEGEKAEEFDDCKLFQLLVKPRATPRSGGEEI